MLRTLSTPEQWIYPKEITMGKTLYEKVYDAHVAVAAEGENPILYIDRHLVHEVTSPQAFNGLRQRGLGVLRPSKTTATPDHNIPTWNQDKPIADPISKFQVETLTKNCEEFGITLYGLGNKKNGIWKEFYVSGEPKVVENYVGGKLEGERITYFSRDLQVEKKETYK